MSGKGLSVIQEKFNSELKTKSWRELDPWLANDIYLQPGFLDYFNANAGYPVDGLYPTVTVRKIMWSLRMKPLRKEYWEEI